MPTKTKTPKARIYTVAPLSDRAMENGLTVPEDHPLWKAVMCFLETRRANYGADAATFMEEEKTHKAALALGGYDALGDIIFELETKRKTAYAKTHQ